MKSSTFRTAALMILLALSGALMAQDFHQLDPVPGQQVDVRNLGPDWNPSMLHLEAPVPGGESTRGYLRELKAQYAKQFVARPSNVVGIGHGDLRATSDVPMPTIEDNFEGNAYNFSVPNDNDVAISNDGAVVSVTNTTAYFMDSMGNVNQVFGLGGLVDTLGISAGKFDPKVQYDPIEDRFVMCFLGGFSSTDTYIFLAFSSTNDPLDLWNVYFLPGNPLNNDTWTDYPMIALTEDEVFVTINLLRQGEPWQTGFSETLIWQMGKAEGYAGNPLDVGFWDNVDFGGKPIRNLRPVQGGSTLAGPDLWLLSNRNFAETNDTIFMVHVTGLHDDPGTTVEIDFIRAETAYGAPPVARQPSNHTFDTNDGRILGAFIEGERIQFVANTVVPTTGLAGVYHGIIENIGSTPSLMGTVLGDISMDSVDFGYPNISFTGTDPSEIQSMISFEYSGPGTRPSFGAVYHNYNAYSDLVTIKEGETRVDILGGVYERWGDYTGSQRVYDRPGTVWVSGNWGKNVAQPGPDCRCNATWVAELRNTETGISVGLQEEILSPSLKVFPNPAQDFFQVDFEMPETANVTVRIYNQHGQLIKEIWRGRAKTGGNRFSFSTAPLAAGFYVLRVQQEGIESVVISEKVVKL